MREIPERSELRLLGTTVAPSSRAAKTLAALAESFGCCIRRLFAEGAKLWELLARQAAV